MMPLLLPLSVRRGALIAAAFLSPLACRSGESAPAAEGGATVASADAAAPAGTGAAPAALASTGMPQITVYKSPTCGCCAKWVDHLRENGFTVVERDTANLAPIKAEHGIGRHLESCHTGVVDGYVIEGHVPADLIARLLAERPDVAGLAVPGMPMGSPGMEGMYKEAYDVLALGKDGRTTVYAQR